MSTRIVNVNEATVTIRSETRRAALNRARYLKALEAVHPELREIQPLWYINETDPERRAIYQQAGELCTLLSQVVEAHGAPVRLPEGPTEVLGAEDAVAAYNHFLDDETGFWDRLIEATYELTSPVTDAEQQPMHESMIKEAEKADPNSPTDAANGNTAFGTDLPNEPAMQS